MREFWKNHTGKNLRLLTDDAIYEKAITGENSDFIKGMAAMRNYILSLQASEPEQKQDESSEMTTIQT